MTADRTKSSGRIALPLAWYMDIVPRDDGSLQGFVTSPDGRRSASLGFALENGTTSCDDVDKRIPPEVMRALPKYEDVYA